MVGWHHQFDGGEFEEIQGNSEGQGNLACCSPWGCKELDMTDRLNSNKKEELMTHTRMKLQKTLGYVKADTKGHMLYDFI